MKHILLILLFFSSLVAQNLDTNSTAQNQEENIKNAIEVIESKENNATESAAALPPDEPIVVNDTSGLSDDEVRDVAEQADTANKKKKVSVDEVIDAMDNSGKIDLSKIQSEWEDMSPTPKKYDWVQTKSGEWFKGSIKGLYDDELEFDSKEIGEYTFDFDDVKSIKSFNIISVNIENVAEFTGVVRFKDDEITIIQGDKKFTFPRAQVISLAPDGELERHNWSGKISLSFDGRSGNKKQFDYVAKANVKRRTSTNRLLLDYLGRISERDGVRTSDDHRINQSYSTYITRYFFLTPIFSEYYQDSFQNIANQITVGSGLGYTILDDKIFEWDISAGPALLYTEFENVTDNESRYVTSPSLEVNNYFKYNLTTITDIKYSYKFSFTDQRSGRYKHHMILTFENELTSWLDIDVSGVWDYIHNPEEKSDGTIPLKNDFQLLLGLGVDF
jgi:hypothetical protein